MKGIVGKQVVPGFMANENDKEWEKHTVRRLIQLKLADPLYSPMNVLILGSSHIRRLDLFLHSLHIQNMGLDLRLCETLLYGVGGLRLFTNMTHKSMAYNLRFVELVHPEMLLLLIGSNDIANCSKSAFQIASAIYAGANYAIFAGTSKVIILQQFPRRDISHNLKVVAVNACLMRLINGGGEPRIRFWRHRGLWGNTHMTISNDNVHLSPQGNYKLFRSLRGCIIRNILH